MKTRTTLTIILFFIIQVFASAQQEIIPDDADVKVGVLDNGLTYYIRHNRLPKQRAEFYIVQKVGSILEEEHQRGLAHFLEHMCFNGTENFPGNSLVDELEKKGIKFGVNLNAYTSIDETVYNLSNIPVDREGIIDTALLVLHDWSGFILLNDKDIDEERGVIREEWRTRNTAGYRAMKETLKNIFPGSRYAERIPIGLIDVIDNFPYQAIREYYKKWYRPDLQAIIVVGDIDVDLIESKIIKLFSDIQLPENAEPRKEFGVLDNIEPIVSIVTDPEIQHSEISVFFKREVIKASEKNTTAHYSTVMAENLVASMFNQRMYEISQKNDPPFNGAAGGFGPFSVAKTKRAWGIKANPRNNKDWEKSLRTLLLENERIKRFGFTNTELERAKINTLRNFESGYKERNKRVNKSFVSMLVQNFLNSEPYPDIEWTYNFVQEFLSGLELEEVNSLASTLATDTNVVFTFTGTQNDNIVPPTPDDILRVWNESKKAELFPYNDEIVDEKLFDVNLTKGKIIKTEQQAFGYTQWTLSNGIKVLCKRTNYKEDQVVMTAYSPGGISLIAEENLPSALAMNNLAILGGVGNLNQVRLKKLLTGKKVNVSPFVNGLSEGINASASPKDFETLLQLTYLAFTQPRRDEDAFKTWATNTREQMTNASLNPMNSLNDTLTSILTCNHPRSIQFNIDVLEKIDYNKSLSLFKERFSDASDFTFFITGNINLDSIKGDVETYLGALPSTYQNEKFVDWKMYPPKGVIKKHFERKMEIPKSSIVVIYTGEIPYTLENAILMDFLKSTLDIVYTENIREKEGATYGVSVNGTINKYPTERYSLQIQFDTDPSLREKLLTTIYDEINKISRHNPDNVSTDKIKKYMLKKHTEKQVNNRYWQSVINAYIINGIDVSSDYEKIVSSVTPSMIRKFAKKIFSQKNIVEVSMNPEEY